ncbi:MAG: hypothetical protein IH599_05805 [Bacteroidales bacterium]|nr:hypothetical protein [Bacteroidales bacterium]
MVYTADAMPVNRMMEQMGQKIEMSYGEDKAGIAMAGMNMEIPFKAAYISDGPGLDHIIARWPLKTGFTLVTELPDLTTIKAKQVQFSVVSQEMVQDKNCWKVEMTVLRIQKTSPPSGSTRSADQPCAWYL